MPWYCTTSPAGSPPTSPADFSTPREVGAPLSATAPRIWLIHFPSDQAPGDLTPIQVGDTDKWTTQHGGTWRWVHDPNP